MAQSRQIRMTNNRVSSAESVSDHRMRRADNEIAELAERFERMRTTCEAMWQLVCETTGLTDAHLTYRVYELDVADGQKDGKRTIKSTPCECGAMVNAKVAACQFCGAPAPARSPWDSV